MVQEGVMLMEQVQFPGILGTSFFLPMQNSETMKYYLCEYQSFHFFDLLTSTCKLQTAVFSGSFAVKQTFCTPFSIGQPFETVRWYFMGSEELWSFMSQLRKNSGRGKRSLAAYSPRAGTESDTTEDLRLSLTCQTASHLQDTALHLLGCAIVLGCWPSSSLSCRDLCICCSFCLGCPPFSPGQPCPSVSRQVPSRPHHIPWHVGGLRK